MTETRSNMTIADWTDEEAAAFMDSEWPAHDAPLGLKWESRDVTLVAKRDGIAVGAARGVMNGGLGVLNQLLVRKDDAKRGIGSQLLREFESRCRSAGCHKIRLETGDYQARPFYEHHGFSVAATLTNDRFGRTWFVMAKAL